ncbi:CGLD27 family protein [Vulcanococcus limneticus Candia 3F8]|uniref:CGLD27 family protein n=1 Tax=Vulcanococcus limneticus TaxID=2170428 RepID=UPI000B995427|nr:CGLD27 family protein [Vulcanococcus limneticus]MCP9790918.1 CGLD27 family protein [Vulcanococcus limneticus MW73D5]MCP9894006.1 CGLD27 family protein [Vulcanococcus limneticus Candia 3F8]MCP9896036.1 CGLD27 family protein [Vulcanococcus limneticus Candia 3B3]
MAAPGPPDPGAVATAACPVPPAQRPLEQYRELAASWFFAWPHASFASLLRPLAVSWLLLLPGAWLVASGSVALRHDPPRLVAAGAVAALVLPLLLLTRQWLGWTSIQRRLVATAVEYEESGWYDGQVWEKPLAWREQDLLVATHQVRPVLERLQRALAIASVLLLAGASLCQAL